jgi:hypothetical protein
MTKYRRFYLSEEAAEILDDLKFNKGKPLGPYISMLVERDHAQLGLPDELACANEFWEVNFRWLDDNKDRLMRVILPVEIDAKSLSNTIAQPLLDQGFFPVLVEGYRRPNPTREFKLWLIYRHPN